jgi:hypothetical protein
MEGNKGVLIAIGLAVLLLVAGKDKADAPLPSRGAEAVAAKALQEFADVMADAAEEAAGMEPNKAAKSLAGKVVPGFDEALKPVNELIDRAIEDGTFAATMRKVAKGYRKAGQ